MPPAGNHYLFRIIWGRGIIGGGVIIDGQACRTDPERIDLCEAGRIPAHHDGSWRARLVTAIPGPPGYICSFYSDLVRGRAELTRSF